MYPHHRHGRSALFDTFRNAVRDRYKHSRVRTVDKLLALWRASSDEETIKKFMDNVWESHALLVERCLNIGLRLRFDWVPGEAQAVKTKLVALEPVAKYDRIFVRERLTHLCEAIEKIRHAGGWPGQ
jgi:hypothetical protein